MPDAKISALPAIPILEGGDMFGVADASDLTESKSATADQIRAYVSQGLYAPGSFTVPTGQFRIMAKRLVLTGTQTVRLEADSTLAIL